MTDILEHLPPTFVNWGWVDGAKVPVDGRTGKKCNHLDPSNWKTLAEARQSEWPVAFVLTPNCGWFFVDLDKCHNGTDWTPEAQQIFQNFNGAMYEISQSGNGLHIMGRCDPRQLQDRRHKWDGWKEFYTENRFVAFSENGWHPIGGTFRPDLDWTANLRHVIPQKPDHDAVISTSGRDPAWSGPEDDDELIRRALRSTGGALGAFGSRITFGQLWERDVKALEQFYPAENERPDGNKWDWSSAELALVNHLAFWTGKDMARMDRLFRRSKLYRADKWGKRADIRNSTLITAISGTKDVYQQKKSPEGHITDGGVQQEGTSSLLLISEQIKHFEGFVYIRDLNKIFTPDGALVSMEAFDRYYGGFEFQIDPTNAGRRGVTDSASKAFTMNRGHRFPRAHSVFWDPKLPPREITDERLNTWSPPKVIHKQGDIGPFMELLQKLLPDERDRRIILNFMAATIQKPGVKFQWAPVLQGAPGNGKTLLTEFLRYAVGEEVTHKPDANNLTEKFNGYLEGKVLIVVEEIHMSEKREVLDTLKPLLTNEDVEVRNMGTEKRMVKNLANWFFLTNHRDAIMKTSVDRRYCVMFTAQQSVQDMIDAGYKNYDGTSTDYFPKLWQWAREEGFAIVAQYLSNFMIEAEFDPSGSCVMAPWTSTTSQVLLESNGRVESEILEAIESERIGFKGGFVSSIKLTELFREQNIRVNRNKVGEIMGNIGYVKCPVLPGGRAARNVSAENNGKPTLYVPNGREFDSSEDPLNLYLQAQGYLPSDPVGGSVR